jgi:hypothetical protein
MRTPEVEPVEHELSPRRSGWAVSPLGSLRGKRLAPFAVNPTAPTGGSACKSGGSSRRVPPGSAAVARSAAGDTKDEHGTFG